MLTMIAAPDDAGRRLDRLLRKALPGLPLSAIHRLLRKRQVLLDGKPTDASARVGAGAIITVMAPDTISRPVTALTTEPRQTSGTRSPAQVALTAESILWQGNGLLILNKPAGLPTHGADSLETRARAFLADKLPPSLSFKSGPLHRLDTPTSGVIVFSTSLEGARYFSALIREQRVRKRYLALLDGHIDKPARWEDALFRDKAAKKTRVVEAGAAPDTKLLRARTVVYPLAVNAGCSLVMVEISTGKTHQIRAQAAFHGYPLLGDRKYGGNARAGGLLLHAYSLEFSSPSGEALVIKAPLPRAFYRYISAHFGACPDLP
ncbi:MAG: RluA family pseudouridine synthase [Treponema sp.]|nr:RluA family pseudouridine synthase [Treponema sp.]